MRIRWGWMVALAVVASLLGAPANGEGTPARAEVTQRAVPGGVLKTTVKGLPKGVKAPLVVTGPHGYRKKSHVAKAWVLRRLAPGRYRVRAHSVSSKGYTWKAKVSPDTVRVTKARGRKVSVRYAHAMVPGAPGAPALVPGDARLAVSWSAPATAGSSPIIDYTATAQPGGRSCTAAALSCTLTGLTNGSEYSVTVTARNVVGVSPPSAATKGTPSAGFRPYAGMTTLSAGRDHTCGIDHIGRPWCWGSNSVGQLGDGTYGPAEWEPIAVQGSLTATAISAGGFHTCALVGELAWCWGDDNSGQLGDGDSQTFSSAIPLAVAGGHLFTSLTSGGSHTCALDTAGKAWCWGEDEDGQLGDGDADASDRYVPFPVAGDHTFSAISAGWASTCALDTAGKAWCWGDNQAGQLGTGDTGGTPQRAPAAVAGDRSFAVISAGWSHTCALDTSAAAWCWGVDRDPGGGGSALTRITPDAVTFLPVAVPGGHAFATVSAGGFHTCALDTSGSGWCWGENQNGQLGNADTAGTDRPEPASVAGSHTLAGVASGGHHSCALDTNGTAWCWGWYYQGRLGLGEDVKEDQFAPAPVAGGHTFLKP